MPGDGVVHLVINLKAAKESKAQQKKGQEEETPEQPTKNVIQLYIRVFVVLI